jgi:MerR family copper efflux transcriptional regulator
LRLALLRSLPNVWAKMVKHYEGLGLLAPVARMYNGYRQYGEADVRTLQFIKRGRELGFSMFEISELVGLWHNRTRASSSVKRIAQKHVEDLRQRIEAMQSMQRTLASLLTHCPVNERPDCPILDNLAGDCCKT